MKFCKNCNINVNTEHSHCPLCFNAIEPSTKENQPKLLTETGEKPTELVKTHMVRKVFILLSIAAVLITAIINYFTKTTPWSLIVLFSVIYLWILVKHTIMSSRHAFEKVFFQVISIISVLVTTNYISGGGWFAGFVLPSLLLAVITILNFILLFNKKRKRFEISFIIIELMILIVAIIFICTSFIDYKIIHWIVLTYSILSICGIVVMDGKNLYQEVVKKFHL